MSKNLIIGDIHQDLNFIKKIFLKEKDFSHITLLGDFFDSRKNSSEISSVTETSEFLLYLDREFGNKITWLHSNHDIAYAYALPLAKKRKYNPYLNPFVCSNHTINAAIEIAKILPNNFFDKFKLASYRDGVLFSHAGISPGLVPKLNGKYDIEFFLKKTDDIAKSFRSESFSEYLGCGIFRGGSSYVGGLTWLDWNEEFIDDPLLPSQVCGHTAGIEPRRKGKNWNIDCCQNWYATIDKGVIEFKIADEDKYSKDTEGKTLSFRNHSKANI